MAKRGVFTLDKSWFDSNPYLLKLGDITMAKKAEYTVDELKKINAEMLANNWDIKVAAVSNTVRKFDKWQTLYMAFRRNGLPTNAKKANKAVAVAA